MEDKEEEIITVRKTRSAGKGKSTPPKPKPTTRRTRKKVVVMEVEVSDDEEGSAGNVDSDEKSEKKERKEVGSKKEADQNGSEDSDVLNQISDDAVVVFNDIEMLKAVDVEDPKEVDENVQTKRDETVPASKQVEGEDYKGGEKVVDKRKELVVECEKVKIQPEETMDVDEIQPETWDKIEHKAEKVKVDSKEEISNLAKEDDIKCEKNEGIKEDKNEFSEVDKGSSKDDKKQESTKLEVDHMDIVKDEKDKASERSDIKVDEKKEEEAKILKIDKKELLKEPAEKEVTEKEQSITETGDKQKTEERKLEGESKEVSPKDGEKRVAGTESKKDKKDAKKDKGVSKEKEKKHSKQNGDPDAENISEDELPEVQVAKVPEAEEVSDEELPGPKRAELPADTEVVSEDELPSVKSDKSETKKDSKKRKIDEANYDPCSPTSESETPNKKIAVEASEKEKEEKPKPKKLPELDKYWKAVNDDPTDFTGWTYLLQYVDQENDMEAAREAYDAFLSHYPYCYGYWRKYADYEKRKGNKKKCEEVFERGLKAIPLSVDLWLHYLAYVRQTRADDEEYIRSQFERALAACGLEFRSDRLWDQYVKWETEGKRPRKVTMIYDRLLATPTQGYTTHFDNFQEHVAAHPPNKIVELDEFFALRKEVRSQLKSDGSTPVAPKTATATAGDAGTAPTGTAAPGVGDDDEPPPGEEAIQPTSDEESKAIKERIVSIRRKIHKATVNAVTARWNYEEGIKRPYFHVKPLERCQLKNWQDYLDYETEQGDRTRIIVLFERCLIACALYEEFWLKFVHYLESLKDPSLQPKIRDVYERACTIHHLKKSNLHLQWAMFEEGVGNSARAAEILVNLEKSVPNILQIAYRRINLERRRGDFEKCTQLYEHYINNSKNKMISSNIAIKFSRFCFKVMKDVSKAQEALKTAIAKDPNNPRLYLQLIDLTLQKPDVTEAEVTTIIDQFLEKESTEADQKVLFAQRKLEYLEDFGSDVRSVQEAAEQYQKYLKLNKEATKKKEVKVDTSSTAAKKEKASATPSSTATSSYTNYSGYGASSGQPAYPYSSSQQGQYNYSQYGQGDQYQYQNWQYPQGGYGGYNQWGGYGGGYGY